MMVGLNWVGSNEYLHPRDKFPIRWDGVEYPTLMHAWQATKADSEDGRLVIAGMKLTEVTDLASYVPDKPEWLEESKDLLLDFACQKFGLVPGYDWKKSLYNAYRLVCQSSALIYYNQICDTRLGVCNCNAHLMRNTSGTGENLYGKYLTAIRGRLIHPQWDDYQSEDCDWCFWNKRHNFKQVPATGYVLWMQQGHLVRRATCEKHRGAWCQDARKNSDDRHFLYMNISTTPGWEPTQSSLVLVQHSTHTDSPFTPLAATPVHRYSYVPQTWGLMRIRPGSPTHINLMRTV